MADKKRVTERKVDKTVKKKVTQQPEYAEQTFFKKKEEEALSFLSKAGLPKVAVSK